MFGQPDLQVTRWGTVKIDWQTMMTPMEGVFAGGDIVRGASLVVWGVKDGRDAARRHPRLSARTRQHRSKTEDGLGRDAHGGGGVLRACQSGRSSHG